MKLIWMLSVVVLMASCDQNDEELCQREFFEESKKIIQEISQNQPDFVLKKVDEYYDQKISEMNQKWTKKSCTSRQMSEPNAKKDFAEDLKKNAFRAKYIK